MSFDAREVSVLGLTAMIKIFGQMRNLRRGHDTQGMLKRIRLDKTEVGYANYMAPRRIVHIRDEVKQILDHLGNNEPSTRLQQDAVALKHLEDDSKHKLVQPKSDTFLTPEWDELVPFPTSKSLLADSISAFFPSHPTR